MNVQKPSTAPIVKEPATTKKNLGQVHTISQSEYNRKLHATWSALDYDIARLTGHRKIGF